MEWRIVDGKYSRAVRDGLPHGEGDWVQFGVVYKGKWRNEKREGLHIGKGYGVEVDEKNYKDGKYLYQKST